MMPGLFLVGWVMATQAPVVVAWSLGALAGAATVPRLRAQRGGHLIGTLRPEGRTGGDPVVAGDR